MNSPFATPQPATGQKWRSRPVSRVLSWTTIPLGPASPQGSSSTPGDGSSQPIVPLFGLAPSGVYRAMRRCPRTRWALTPPFHPYHAPLRAVRRSVLCCTSRRLAPPRDYLALCSVEPGLSSARLPATRLSWPTPPRLLSHGHRLATKTCGLLFTCRLLPHSAPYSALRGAPLSSAASLAACEGDRCSFSRA